MKLAPVAVVLFVLCGILSAAFAADSFETMLHRMRCKDNWDCKQCYEVKRQGRCHSGYLMGVCYKTCTGCDRYIDKPDYDCQTIYKQGKCFQKTINNPYITYAQRCEASCCQAYPLEVPLTAQPKTSQPSKPTTASPPKVIWKQWSQWSPCSTSCNVGYQKRNRTCSYSRDPKVICTRPQSQFRYCNKDIPCEGDAGWSTWSQWGTCSQICGSSGTQTRTRTCTNPPPPNGGRDCQGPSSETRACNHKCCPEAGDWSRWSVWSSCSKTCCSSKNESGIKTRTRTCTNPAPYCGGRPCDGPYKQTKPCYPKIHCTNPTTNPSPYWSSWGSWGPCSATCYVGYRERRRRCIGYQGHDIYCDGRSTQFESCNTHISCY